MILAGALLLFAYVGIGDQEPRPRALQDGVLNVRQQIVIRVTAGLRRAPAPGAPLVEWREGRGPRCVPAGRIVAATFPSQSSVDLIFRDRSRIRARLERRCAALDFYRSFYVEATPDGQICADRDSIRSRTGGECEIDQFRSLSVRPARP